MNTAFKEKRNKKLISLIVEKNNQRITNLEGALIGKLNSNCDLNVLNNTPCHVIVSQLRTEDVLVHCSQKFEKLQTTIGVFLNEVQIEENFGELAACLAESYRLPSKFDCQSSMLDVPQNAIAESTNAELLGTNHNLVVLAKNKLLNSLKSLRCSNFTKSNSIGGIFNQPQHFQCLSNGSWAEELEGKFDGNFSCNPMASCKKADFQGTEVNFTGEINPRDSNLMFENSVASLDCGKQLLKSRCDADGIWKSSLQCESESSMSWIGISSATVVFIAIVLLFIAVMIRFCKRRKVIRIERIAALNSKQTELDRTSSHDYETIDEVYG